MISICRKNNLFDEKWEPHLPVDMTDHPSPPIHPTPKTRGHLQRWGGKSVRTREARHLLQDSAFHICQGAAPMKSKQDPIVIALLAIPMHKPLESLPSGMFEFLLFLRKTVEWVAGEKWNQMNKMFYLLSHCHGWGGLILRTAPMALWAGKGQCLSPALFYTVCLVWS